ncbi:MAG TPA: hypothetical protein VMW52_09880 [Phycisphaerae bacterium]|nr:hypothetical protein [Phycisphaerae bacterium]
MAYDYEREKPNLFTDEGQRMFLRIRDRAHELILAAGAARMQEIIRGNSGELWEMLACVDRLVELGELREITLLPQPGPMQYRVFVRAAKEGA